MDVFRILSDDGVQCNGSHGDPDELAIYTNESNVDRAVRHLNDPKRRHPAAPQPKGRPYRKDKGWIVWDTV